MYILYIVFFLKCYVSVSFDYRRNYAFPFDHRNNYASPSKKVLSTINSLKLSYSIKNFQSICIISKIYNFPKIQKKKVTFYCFLRSLFVVLFCVLIFLIINIVVVCVS
jgi:hypothetical protein